MTAPLRASVPSMLLPFFTRAQRSSPDPVSALDVIMVETNIGTCEMNHGVAANEEPQSPAHSLGGRPGFAAPQPRAPSAIRASAANCPSRRFLSAFLIDPSASASGHSAFTAPADNCPAKHRDQEQFVPLMNEDHSEAPRNPPTYPPHSTRRTSQNRPKNRMHSAKRTQKSALALPKTSIRLKKQTQTNPPLMGQGPLINGVRA